MLGRKGVESQLEIELWPKEVSALQHSAQVLRETIDLVLKSNPNAAKGAPASAPASAAKPGNGVKVTMGAGGSSAGGSGKSRVTISGQWGGGRNG